MAQVIVSLSVTWEIQIEILAQLQPSAVQSNPAQPRPAQLAQPSPAQSAQPSPALSAQPSPAQCSAVQSSPAQCSAMQSSPASPDQSWPKWALMNLPRSPHQTNECKVCGQILVSPVQMLSWQFSCVLWTACSGSLCLLPVAAREGPAMGSGPQKGLKSR